MKKSIIAIALFASFGASAATSVMPLPPMESNKFQYSVRTTGEVEAVCGFTIDHNPSTQVQFGESASTNVKGEGFSVSTADKSGHVNHEIYVDTVKGYIGAAGQGGEFAATVDVDNDNIGGAGRSGEIRDGQEVFLRHDGDKAYLKPGTVNVAATITLSCK